MTNIQYIILYKVFHCSYHTSVFSQSLDKCVCYPIAVLNLTLVVDLFISNGS